MKRAPIVLTSTVAGLAATVGFHAHQPSATPIASTAATDTTAAAAAAATSSGSTASQASTPGTPVSASITSAVEPNQYGNVQLKVTVRAGKLTAVQAVQLPQNDGKSVQINAYAEPVLQQSALTAQNSRIDAVSGATYTSESYKLALQSALDKAGLAAKTGATS
jgi:uncharacterized protein with FMN-binding domain